MPTQNAEQLRVGFCQIHCASPLIGLNPHHDEPPNPRLASSADGGGWIRKILQAIDVAVSVDKQCALFCQH